MLGLLLGASQGCVLRAGEDLGAGLVRGALAEAGPEGENGGVNAILDDIAERKIVAELGEQLGAGLIGGVGEITEEQRRSIEGLVDGAITVAAKRGGSGVRDELSPELRRMIRESLVEELVAGLRGDVGDSLAGVADRTVNAAMGSVRANLNDPEMRVILGELIRESVYLAVREGRPGSPGVGETLELTLNDNLLTPFERSVSGLTGVVADRVDESNKRIEQTLTGIISFLVLILGVFVLLFFMTRRQLAQERVNTMEAQAGLRSVDAALSELDDETRAKVVGKAGEYKHFAEQIAGPSGRSEDYVRGGGEPAPPAPTRPPISRSSGYERGDGGES